MKPTERVSGPQTLPKALKWLTRLCKLTITRFLKPLQPCHQPLTCSSGVVTAVLARVELPKFPQFPKLWPEEPTGGSRQCSTGPRCILAGFEFSSSPSSPNSGLCTSGSHQRSIGPHGTDATIAATAHAWGCVAQALHPPPTPRPHCTFPILRSAR